MGGQIVTNVDAAKVGLCTMSGSCALDPMGMLVEWSSTNVTSLREVLYCVETIV